MPRKGLYEPAVGDGAISNPMAHAGYEITGADIVDRSNGRFPVRDYLTSEVPEGTSGIITNPPFKLLNQFIRKATADAGYAAFLCRLNALEGVTHRLPMFREMPPARLWVSSRRLPMMHRGGWEGKKSTSNMTFCWLVWDSAHCGRPEVGWFDWKEHVRHSMSDVRMGL